MNIKHLKILPPNLQLFPTYPGGSHYPAWLDFHSCLCEHVLIGSSDTRPGLVASVHHHLHHYYLSMSLRTLGNFYHHPNSGLCRGLINHNCKHLCECWAASMMPRCKGFEIERSLHLIRRKLIHVKASAINSSHEPWAGSPNVTDVYSYLWHGTVCICLPHWSSMAVNAHPL